MAEFKPSKLLTGAAEGVLGVLGKIADGAKKVGGTIKDAAMATPLGKAAQAGASLGSKAWRAVETVPFLGAPFRKIREMSNNLKASRTTGLIKTYLSEIKAKLAEIIWKLVNALNKETEKNGKAVKKEIEKNPSAKKEEAMGRSSLSKSREISEPSMGRNASVKNRAAERTTSRAADKGLPMGDLSEKLSAAKGSVAPVAGPGMEAGTKAVSKLTRG